MSKCHIVGNHMSQLMCISCFEKCVSLFCSPGKFMLITGILQVNLFQTDVSFHKATYNKIRMVQVHSIYFGATDYSFKRLRYFFL